jgi:hypothetical protein
MGTRSGGTALRRSDLDRVGPGDTVLEVGRSVSGEEGVGSVVEKHWGGGR